MNEREKGRRMGCLFTMGVSVVMWAALGAAGYGVWELVQWL